MDETNLTVENMRFFEARSNILRKNFESRRINFHSLQNRKQIQDIVCNLIEKYLPQLEGPDKDAVQGGGL